MRSQTLSLEEEVGVIAALNWHEPWTDVDKDGKEVQIPPLKHLKQDIGNMLNKALAAIKDGNDALAGVLKNNIDFNAVKTVGSGGFLIQAHQYVEEQGQDPNDLALYGQDSNGTVWSIRNMNLILGKEKLIHEILIEDDVIEAIISLPPGLFYGTGIPACALVVNKTKSDDLQDKILFINADREYAEGKAQNKLRPEDVEKID